MPTCKKRDNRLRENKEGEGGRRREKGGEGGRRREKEWVEMRPNNKGKFITFVVGGVYLSQPVN